ncbi:CPBP family intramembrane metalloprotease [Pontibacter sp. KCTC 32443]|uniref:CPBP family intramembrane glutamic endopeptidase n=1 Tax=Pontibacter TaxID=323449 RepID=UPI00164D068B|nr:MULTISPECIES: CPBP family intramembrane glutamic endopeptidase [Pontibacter]MBC5774262.1 CPBP family intramembrane metalloprotease [Pontibacter sp. KCTC 32443]
MLKTFTLNLKQTTTDLIGFLKNPTDSPETEMPIKGKLRELFNLLLINIVLSVALVGIIELIVLLGWVNYDGHAVSEMLRKFPIWGGLLLAVIIVPFFEEVVFRSGLRFRRGYFTLLTALMLFVAGILSFRYLTLFWALGISIAFGGIMIIYLLKAYSIGEFLERKWSQIYGILFYSIAVIFGLVHISNYTNFNYASVALLLIPVLVAPQIWAGLALGYIRVKYGFFWGFFLHAAHNAVFIVPTLLFINQLEEKLNIHNENYSLKVEEHFRYDDTAGSTSIISGDTVAFENTKLNDVITHLLQTEEVSIQNKIGNKSTRAVNLYYKSETSDLAKTKAAILAELQKLYKFDVTKADVQKEMWDVEVENTTALAANISNRGDKTSEVMVDKKGIKMHNVTMEQLIGTLQKEYNIALADKTTDEGRYNFKFSKMSFEELKSELKEKYGLVLQSKMIMTQQALVEFRK